MGDWDPPRRKEGKKERKVRKQEKNQEQIDGTACPEQKAGHAVGG